MKTRKNGCFNAHPHKPIECVRGVHSFHSDCVARAENEMLTSTWRGQTVFLITDGGWPVGVKSDRSEAERLVNARNLRATKAFAATDIRQSVWRVHPFTVNADVLELLPEEPSNEHSPRAQELLRTLETDLHEDR